MHMPYAMSEIRHMQLGQFLSFFSFCEQFWPAYGYGFLTCRVLPALI